MVRLRAVEVSLLSVSSSSESRIESDGAPFKPGFGLSGVVRTRYRVAKNSCFVSGPDFKSGRKRLRKNWALEPLWGYQISCYGPLETKFRLAVLFTPFRGRS
jgi:hypothetical protein